MLGKTTLFALIGAVAVSASEVHHLMTRSALFTRQISAANIPATCQSGCASALTIYQACTSGDTTTCLGVCQSSNFASFTGCLQCIVNNTPGASASDVQTLNTALQQLSTACNAAGSPVASTAIAASGSGGGAGASASSASGAARSGASSAAGAASSVVAGASSVAAGARSSVGGALSSVANAASSVAAAASSSRSAGDAVTGFSRGLGAVVVGAVGVVAGAALVL